MDPGRIHAYLQAACAGLGFDIGEVWFSSTNNGTETVSSLGGKQAWFHFLSFVICFMVLSNYIQSLSIAVYWNLSWLLLVFSFHQGNGSHQRLECRTVHWNEAEILGFFNYILPSLSIADGMIYYNLTLMILNLLRLEEAIQLNLSKNMSYPQC